MRGNMIVGGVLVAVSIAACGSDSTGGDINQPTPTNQISIVAGAESKGSAAFAPNPLSISLAAGGVAKWVNNDRGRDDGYGGMVGGVAHNITSDDGAFTSGTLSPGSTFSATFGAAGTYGYHCSVHPTMIGEVTVTP